MEDKDHGDCTEVVENFVEIVSKAIRMLVPIEKADSAPRRISLGVVLEPDFEDLQGDTMDAADIELSAHAWMEESQAGGEMHVGVCKGAKVVESYLAPCDFTVDTAAGPELVRKGCWLLAMRWPEEQWAKIHKGEYTGYSVGGQGVRVPIDEDITKSGWAPGPDAHWARTGGNVGGGGGGPSEDTGRTANGSQPKVQNIKGSEMYASANGAAQVHYGDAMWLGGGGVAKAPSLHQLGSWAVYPHSGRVTGGGPANIEDLIWGHTTTLAELINRLPPGEYDLAT